MNKRQRFFRSGIIILIVLSLLVSVPAALTWRAWRQACLNHTLLVAIEAYDLGKAQRGLQNGANANAVNYEHHHSSYWETLRDLFLKRKTNVDRLNSTALHLAVSNGDPVIVECLLQHGASVETLNRQQETALHLAAEQSDAVDMVSILIAHGAKVNHQDRDGNTPLMNAVEPGNIEIIGFLIAHGADINIKNYYGSTALFLAQRGDYAQPKIAHLLQQAGKHR